MKVLEQSQACVGRRHAAALVWEFDARTGLCSNKLDALPSLAALKALKAVLLKYNGFVELPASLASLPQLEVLDVSGNQLRSLDNAVLLALPKLRCACCLTVLRPASSFACLLSVPVLAARSCG